MNLSVLLRLACIFWGGIGCPVAPSKLNAPTGFSGSNVSWTKTLFAGLDTYRGTLFNIDVDTGWAIKHRGVSSR